MARITTIDPNPAARHFTAAAAVRAGHEVEEVAPDRLLHVLDRLSEHKPDLLIVEILMPDCPGRTLIRACREDALLRDLRILVLTAHGDPQLPQFLHEMGNTHFLAKPVALERLSECIDLALSGQLDPAGGPANPPRGRVAVVDDSRLTRLYHGACLLRAGFQVVELDPVSIFGIIFQLQEAGPDLLLLDFLMPVFRGDQLARALRADDRPELRDLPILVVTAHWSDELDALQATLDGLEVLLKPVHERELVHKVEEMLGLPHGAPTDPVPG